MFKFVKYDGLAINDCFFGLLKNAGLASFRALQEFDGGCICKKNRFRSVVSIEINGRTLYLKRHFWPWRERIKSLFPWKGREDAVNEWESLLLLNRLGINSMTPVAFGQRKKFCLPSFSLTLTENIHDAEKLETYLPAHFAPPLQTEKLAKKRRYIKKIADFAKDFHGKGLNHQDFYLGHLYVRPKDGSLFIIDIQRVHQRKFIRRRDRVKDLAQLAYSAVNTGVFTRTDFIRFVYYYLGKNKLEQEDKRLISRISAKARRIANHDAKLQMRKRIALNQ